MSSDKISKLLEKYLKIIGKKTRLDILKKLNNIDNCITFSDIQKEIFEFKNGTTSLSFHLNALKKLNLIKSSQKGYSISNLGKEILKKVLEIELTLNHFNKSVLIRTSKYITEPFNLQNIKDFLVREAGMESFLANRISKLVENKLSKTNIKYLTTPLMREYINGILLEEGLENFRHKLTRLGVPPYDTNKFFNDKSYNPNQFIKKLGSEVSEQFLLLNLLPNDLADLFLSRKIFLQHLNYWALRPLSVCLHTNSLLNYLKKKDSNLDLKNVSDFSNYLRFTTQYQKIFKLISSYFSNDILLFNFDQFIDKTNFENNKYDKNIDLLISQINLFNRYNNSPKINIGLNSEKKILFQIIEQTLSTKNVSNNNSFFLFIDYLKIKNGNLSTELLKNEIILKNIDKFVFYKGQKNLISSILVKPNTIEAQNSNRIILDKILINLDQIAIDAKQDDNKFFEILENRMNSTFSLFKHKEILSQKKIGNSSTWKNIIEKLFENQYDNWINNTIKSLSFVGLNKAIIRHCGLELDRIEQSESFTLKIFEFMRKIIREKNDLDDNMYCLSQPIKKFDSYDYNLIRTNSNLTLERKITLFKKLSQFIDGGTLFEVYLDLEEKDQMLTQFNLLIDSDISAFKFVIKRD
ncbi:MAG: hypothetical protein KGD63_00130 [Candidatus Lokiarchaeota archaeon]|nr:hypothetical protein [Candidatus Lokiarchaeota archaeon]